MKYHRLLFSFGLLPILLIANPKEPHVAHGKATFAYPTKTMMKIRVEDQTIINWNDFSIASQECTQFIQPSSSSAVLNRVTSQNVSHLMGTLQGTGNVFLINPNGILIGKGAMIDTNAFVASTLDILDSEFLHGKDLRFRGPSEEKVVNLGTIHSRGGDIALIGRYVENHGLLQSPKGMVALAAGKEVLLKPSGDERIFISPLSEEGKKSGIGIQNQGTIEALKVRLLADGNPYKVAINHEGKIDATLTEKRHGEVYLVAEKGAVEVNGEISTYKGEVRVLGETVVLHEKALINASSHTGGGQVFVGGSFQGKDPALINSQLTYLHPGSTIKVNSETRGNGGLAVVWSDGATHFHGLIEAGGGSEGGDGGLVEVSGKRFLDIAGGVTKRPAPAGTPGKLLLDPSDVKITGAATSGIIFSPPMTYTPTVLSSNLLVTDLITQLLMGPVEVTTNSGFGGNGDITIASDMTSANGYATSNELIFTSDRDLIVQASVQNSGNGNITCNVGRDLRMDGEATVSKLGTQLGNVTIKTGRHLLLAGGAGGQAQIGFDNPTMNSNINLTVGGDLVVQATTRFALIGHTNTSGLAPVSFNGNITINSVGGNLLMSAAKTDLQFSQIGIASDQSNSAGSGPVTISGNVDIRNVAGTVKMMGGIGGTGTYTLIGHGGRGRSFTDTYSGDISLQSVGDISIVGGQDTKAEKFCGVGFAQEFATSSTHNITSNLISVKSSGNIFINAGQGLNHGFIGAFTGEQTGIANCSIGSVQVRANNNLTLLGSSSAGVFADAAIGITGNNGPALCNIDVSVGNALFIKGGSPSSGASNAFIGNGVGASPQSGSINIIVERSSLNLIGGLPTGTGMAQAFIRSSGDLRINVAQGDLNITSRDPAFISANGISTVFAGGSINVMGNREGAPAFITNSAPLQVRAGHDVNFMNNSLIQNSSGILTIIAGNNINMSAQSFIRNATGNPIHIVCDHPHSSHLGIGGGAFHMPQGAQIIGGGPIRIYTALQNLNTIEGLIGGASFIPGPLYADRSPEKWLTYFSSSFFHSNSPFTIFYKDGVLSSPNIERSQVVMSEMLTSLHPYDEYLGWTLEFQASYASKGYEKGVSSFQVIPEQPYFLRMKKNFDHSPRIHHLIIFPKPLEVGHL
ncbi:MAG: filamentous hemagglutinin N-terminal domain-containing protein [Chlamydiia bacterium]|nr:filamentous hemagglutinin N-terminal domain-containing protein [Chlamydiia bacterium]